MNITTTTTTVATMLFNNNSMIIEKALTTIAPTVLTATAATNKILTPLFPTRNLHGLHRINKIKDFSPVTLSTEWPSMARLLVLALLAVVGSIGNVFMISSVMIEDHLKKAGKVKSHFFSFISFFVPFSEILLFILSIERKNDADLDFLFTFFTIHITLYIFTRFEFNKAMNENKLFYFSLFDSIILDFYALGY